MCADGNQKCIVCESPLCDDISMRIKYNGEWVYLCCPSCSEIFNRRKNFYISLLVTLRGIENKRKKKE